MATLHLTASTTVADLRKEFNEAFGSQVKVYIGNKGADMSNKLSEAGLSKSGDFECRSSLTVATFIERMKEDFGLKVKVYTCDEWVAVLDSLTLEQSGQVKKAATKTDMEKMVGTPAATSAPAKEETKVEKTTVPATPKEVKPTVSSEEEALKARIAELEKELKKQKETPKEASPKVEKPAKKSNDPFEGLMVKVCAGMFRQDISYTYSVDVYPNGDHRKNPEKKWYTQTQSRRVTISKDYYICKYPVTQGQWKAIMGEGFNPSEFRGDDNLPVESVNWEECQEFIKKLNALTGKNYCLPTSAQWEWAAMGASKDNDQGKYAGCNTDEELEQYAWYGKNSDGRTHPVGQKKPNEIGLYDMCGNVAEWCQDVHVNNRDLGTSDAIDPIGPDDGIYRSKLGGAFGTEISPTCSLIISKRDWCDHNFRYRSTGFRLAMSID